MPAHGERDQPPHPRVPMGHLVDQQCRIATRHGDRGSQFVRGVLPLVMLKKSESILVHPDEISDLKPRIRTTRARNATSETLAKVSWQRHGRGTMRDLIEVRRE